MGLKNVYEQRTMNQISFLQKLSKSVNSEDFYKHFRFYLGVASSYGCCDEYRIEGFESSMNERLFAYVMACEELDLLPKFRHGIRIVEEKALEDFVEEEMLFIS